MDAAHHVAQGQMGLALAAEPGHMHKAATRSLGGSALRQQVHQPVQHMVADKGACGLRYLAGHACPLHATQHGLDGQAGKVGGGPAGLHRGVDGLGAAVVGDARIVDVDANALDGQRCPPAGQAQAQCDGRLVLLQQRLQPLQRLPEHRGQLRGHHLVPCNALAVQRLRNQPARVVCAAAKRVKTGQQDGRAGLGRAVGSVRGHGCHERRAEAGWNTS